MSTAGEHREHRPGTQAVERAIAVLECFREQSEPLGITEIARAVGLNISTAHRLVRALVAAGFMEQEITSERYRLGLELAVLGQRALEQSGLHLARPVLEALAASTGESVSLGVRRGQEVVVIEQATSPQPLRFDHPAGAEIQLHASAMGKVLLAFSNESPATTVAGLRGLATYTPRTIAARPALVAALEQIRRAGYATNQEERYAGVCGVAAPVLAHNGLARAAVGLQGPSLRLTPERMEELVPLVQRAAAAIGERLPRL